MTKIEKNDIIKWSVGGFLSGFFAWMFSVLTESFNPIIILYTILSLLGVLIIFNGIEKILIKLYAIGGHWLETNKYQKKVNQMAEAFKQILIEKEIYIVDSGELVRYFDPKISFYKPDRATIGFVTSGIIKNSTLDILNEMINSGILIYIESIKLILLREKMTCIECGGEILFHDKIDHVDIKCQKCSTNYRITHHGLLHDSDKLKLYIRLKHLDRLTV
ncbi:MAG: hypothetical protein ACFFG0_05880 [Candidatus Thorarchaeota archaeon]